MDKLTTNETASAAKVTEAATSLPTTRDGLPVRLGDVVNFYDDGKQQHIGIVRWTGYDKSVCPDGTAIIGIEAVSGQTMYITSDKSCNMHSKLS